jgi:hypothetical protein
VWKCALALGLVGAACGLKRLWQLCQLWHGRRRSTYRSLTRRRFGCRGLARARDQHHGEHRKYRSKNYQSFHSVSYLFRKKVVHVCTPSIYLYRIGKVIFQESDLPHGVPRGSLGREVRRPVAAGAGFERLRHPRQNTRARRVCLTTADWSLITRNQ